MRYRVGLLVTALLAAVAALVSPTATFGSSESDATAHAASYRNPLLDRDFPDPDVIKAANGWYYAYSTGSNPAQGHVNIQVAKSRDLVHWAFRGDALPELPSWGDKAGVSWAPQVVRHNQTYFLYYSIVPNRLRNYGGLCLAVATSKSPGGPFVSTDKPLYCGPTYSDIDPDVFHDPATGDWRVYWGSGGDIVTAKLRPSLTQLVAPHGQPTTLLRGWSSQVHRPFEHGIEGPFVVLHDGWYYLFYSGNITYQYPPHYATMVARSRSATGPYQRLAATRPGLSSVMMHSSRRWKGPGHNSVIRDEAGHDWMFFHAIDSRHPYLPGGDQSVRRPMLMDRIVYKDGWPTVAGNSPAMRWSPAPITR